jgi:hypothetical protein
MTQSVAVFEPYPFKKGQKIHIGSSYRHGDWEVVAVSDRKITLRCPISQKEVCWDRFCYFAGEQDRPWPERGNFSKGGEE